MVNGVRLKWTFEQGGPARIRGHHFTGATMSELNDRIARMRRRFSTVDMLERWLPTPVARVITWARSDEALSTAAGLAFFALIASVPSALIALWIAGSIAGFDTVREAMVNVTSSVEPSRSDVARFAERVVEVAESAGWTAILAAVWPATTYGAGLSRAFDRLTPSRTRPMDGIRGRLLGVVVVAMLPLVVFAALAVVLFPPTGEGGWVIGTLAGGVVSLIALTLLTTTIYHLFSPVDVRVSASVRGATVAASLVLVATVGFAGYVRLGAGSDEQYASSAVALAVLFGLWLYVVNAALIVGYKSALVRADAAAWHGDRWDDRNQVPADERAETSSAGDGTEPSP